MFLISSTFQTWVVQKYFNKLSDADACHLFRVKAEFGLGADFFPSAMTVCLVHPTRYLCDLHKKP